MFRCLVGLEVRQPLEKFFAACCAEDFAAVNLFNGHTVIIHWGMATIPVGHYVPLLEFNLDS